MISITDLISPLDTRTTLVGKTGSGKTRITHCLLEYYKNVVAYDIKAMLKWSGYAVFDNLKDLRRSPDKRKIYRPNLRERRDERVIDEFFFWVYGRGNTVLYVDEISNVGLRANKQISDGYHAVLTMGREKGVTVYQSTQRPHGIPLETLTESERFFVFKQNMEEDRDRMAKILKIDPDLIGELDDFEFYFSDTKEVYGPYKLDL